MLFKKKKNNEQKQHDYQYPIIEGADVYLWKAAEIFTETQQGCAATLQCKLKIGFNRSLVIMDQLYQIGVVGKMKGNTTSSEVLVDKNGLIEIAEKINSSKKSFLKEEYSALKEKNSKQFEKIQMYNNKVDYMTGEDFEIFVAQILKNIGFVNIQLTKGTGDQGVDVIAERDGIKYAIQCKRYSHPVGNKAIQEVFAGKTFYHCHVGVVVTNNYFTQSAKELAKENGIVLWDKDFLNKHIKCEQKIEKSEDSIIEKHYSINGDFTTFSLKERKMIEILGICKEHTRAANLYLTLYTKLKEGWAGKFDFAVVVTFKEAIAIAKNENGVEFFGGKETDGTMAIGIPDWMDKARSEFLNGKEEQIMRMINEVGNYLDEFMEIVIKNM